MALVDRVKNILLSPRTEWPVIDAEPATVASLYTGYIMPLAAIPVVCQAIGFSLIGYSIPFVGGHYKTPIVTALISAAVMYCFTLIGVFIISLVVDALAPSFGGTKNQVQALKVVAYSYTASWVGGILSLIPALSVIGILFGSVQSLPAVPRPSGADEIAPGQGGRLHGGRDHLQHRDHLGHLLRRGVARIRYGGTWPVPLAVPARIAPRTPVGPADPRAGPIPGPARLILSGEKVRTPYFVEGRAETMSP